MVYYLGGYLLLVIQPIKFGSQNEKLVYTGSGCINDSLLDSWSFDWTTYKDRDIDSIMDSYGLRLESVAAIRSWVGAHSENRIGWPCVFSDPDTAHEYRQRFFADLPGVKLLAIYFDEFHAEELLVSCKTVRDGMQDIGLVENLMKKIPERSAPTDTVLGFDVIGVEESGDFHSFHCHDAAAELARRFDLTINDHGLFDAIDDPQAVSAYASDESNGFEPVPWFVCKTVLIG